MNIKFFNFGNRNYFSLLFIIFVFSSFTLFAGSSKEVKIQITKQNTGAASNLRGLSIFDENTVWASGSNGTILMTDNGGTTWNKIEIDNTSKLELRGICALNKNTVIVSSSSPAKIFKTDDCGKTWVVKYFTDKDYFIDSMKFLNEKEGIVLCDPSKDHFVLLKTADGGNNWKEISSKNIPVSIKGESAFAASNTCITASGSKNIWFVTGGSAARVFHSDNGGNNWTVVSTGILHGKKTQGIFSIAFNDIENGIIVGGDYSNDKNKNMNAAISHDAGKTWNVIKKEQPNGYKSCVAFVPGIDRVMITTGTSGVDYSTDGGVTWIKLDSTGYNTVQFAKNSTTGWLIGENGKIAKIIVKKSNTDLK